VRSFTELGSPRAKARDRGGEAALIKPDIVDHVFHRTGFAKTKVEKAVETVFASIKEALNRGERVEFRGFGIFEVRPRKTGVGRNPRNGMEVSIPPGKSIRFRPGKRLRDLP
jgi:DNA-binding protein HU-beta